MRGLRNAPMARPRGRPFSGKITPLKQGTYGARPLRQGETMEGTPEQHFNRALRKNWEQGEEVRICAVLRQIDLVFEILVQVKPVIHYLAGRFGQDGVNVVLEDVSGGAGVQGLLHVARFPVH